MWILRVQDVRQSDAVRGGATTRSKKRTSAMGREDPPLLFSLSSCEVGVKKKIKKIKHGKGEVVYRAYRKIKFADGVMACTSFTQSRQSSSGLTSISLPLYNLHFNQKIRMSTVKCIDPS